MNIEAHKITTLTGHSDAIYTLDNGTEEHLIFSGGGDKVIVQWSLKKFQDKKIITSYSSVIYT
ncbi:MAG: WD40 repeat domain-containing protein, partial [Lutibacter sp.]|nr:WD40 repeat domain-containing protein [Lutibacter sp.]